MPAGSQVEKIYSALVGQRGMDKGKAARIAQSRSGEALATGRPPKGKPKKKPAKKKDPDAKMESKEPKKGSATEDRMERMRKKMPKKMMKGGY